MNASAAKYSLVLIHRGPEYDADFDEIKQEIERITHDISVFVTDISGRRRIPTETWTRPTLVVALNQFFRHQILRGKVLHSKPVPKLTQQAVLRRNNIATPPAEPFKFGMMLDPIIYGEFVVLKTMDLSDTSRADRVYLFRRRRVSGMKADQLPPNHPVRVTPNLFMVQKYIHTGPQAKFLRVLSFLRQPLLCYEISARHALPELSGSDAEVEAAPVAIPYSERVRLLADQPEVTKLALQAHAAFPDIPMLGLDIIRDVNTGQLFVLEINAGGNTWHFSSDIGKGLRIELADYGSSGEGASQRGRSAMINQFGAFKVAAKALVEATQAQAS
jgi:hypothetical protein